MRYRVDEIINIAISRDWWNVRDKVSYGSGVFLGYEIILALGSG